LAKPTLIEELIQALRCLPGVGPRSAQRLAFHLLERDRAGGRRLATALAAAMEGVRRCSGCRTLSETEQCALCADPRRDGGKICVVESPADVLSMERATAYDGRYFVLHGRLSPLDGVRPVDLGLDVLERRLGEGRLGVAGTAGTGKAGGIEEVIVATGGTLEGAATAHYIADLARTAGCRVTRLAQGIPMGGDLEQLDAATLAQAMAGRREIP
jgi:recombination protein RecR